LQASNRKLHEELQESKDRAKELRTQLVGKQKEIEGANADMTSLRSKLNE